jgi:hypothetical protein
MMMVPEAANMPPTPWHTEILASGIWRSPPRGVAGVDHERTTADRGALGKSGCES